MGGGSFEEIKSVDWIFKSNEHDQSKKDICVLSSFFDPSQITFKNCKIEKYFNWSVFGAESINVSLEVSDGSIGYHHGTIMLRYNYLWIRIASYFRPNIYSHHLIHFDELDTNNDAGEYLPTVR